MTARRAIRALTLALIGSIALACPATLSAQVRAMRAPKPPVIDGRLTDESWALATPATDFTQQDPDEGKPATERSEIRILYDDDAIYVGARLFDREPAQIGSRLSTRDNDADADQLTIFIDSMHDRLTGALFRVSASNVQKDAIIYNDTWQDSTWDAVWQSRVAIDDLGWSAEMRIPLSQLRFPHADQQTWGINVQRFIRRKNESVWLAMVPKNQTGLASRMLELVGLDGLQTTRHLELLPYTAARQEMIAPAKGGNPFNDGARAFASAGVDLKWGLTSNLTVNATVNPDFGQVEVDPAVVNLSAFETFFEEKRSFFLEGSQILNNFGTGGSNSFWGFNTSDPSIFYSRRIGRAPQLSASGDFVDPPTATTILGAAKLTGKTSGGWSLGLLEAVTDSESARTQLGDVRGRAVVEPLTNYAVVRVQREIGRRGGAGFMGTSVTRRLDTVALENGLADSAHVFGTDAYVFLDRKRDWVVTGKISGSHVAGTAAVIDRLQRAPQRYYQRPDAEEVHLDPTRTSLGGYAGRINLNRNSGVWMVNAALWGVSPGFESNDLGFHGTGDRSGGHAVFLWRGVTPNRLSRNRSMWVAKWWTWNFARELQGDGFNSRVNLQFLNYWNLGANYGLQRRVLDDRLTRGGPSATRPGGAFWNVDGGTDARRRLSLSGNANYSWTEAHGTGTNASVSLSIKPVGSSRVDLQACKLEYSIVSPK